MIAREKDERLKKDVERQKLTRQRDADSRSCVLRRRRDAAD